MHVCVYRDASQSGVFIIPNKPIKGETSLVKYQVPLKMLENHLGTKLLPQLNPEKVGIGILKDYQCMLLPV